MTFPIENIKGIQITKLLAKIPKNSKKMIKKSPKKPIFVPQKIRNSPKKPIFVPQKIRE